MPRRCTVCAHPERSTIDGAVVHGDSNRRIAARFDLSEAAVRRHAGAHLADDLRVAEADDRALDAARLVDDLVMLREVTLDLLARARRVGDLRGSVLVIREVRANVELLARMAGLIDQRGTRITMGVGVITTLDDEGSAMLERILADPDLAAMAQEVAIRSARKAITQPREGVGP